MQTELASQYIGTPDGEMAQSILSKCVHCGFCTATCPTYQLLGDELDGPRGRIYLIKQIAEGRPATEKTREHLDRCLTCRNCESTCPSGVDYGHLIDIGRKWVEEQTPERPLFEKLLRKALANGLTNKHLFNASMRLGRLFRPLMPAVIQQKIPQGKAPGVRPAGGLHTQKMLMLEGCVQPGMLPNINNATVRVLNHVGVDVLSAAKAGCCGALKYHLNEQEAGLNDMRRNIDAWWPYIAGTAPECQGQKVTALIMNASGCGVTVKEYGHILRDDPAYAEKAKTVSSLCKDLVEILPSYTDALKKHLGNKTQAGVVYHPPCTLQHGQKIKGQLESFLGQLGIKTNLCEDSHLCCGSAGTYSILQADLSKQLKQQKLDNLQQAVKKHEADRIVSANIGCITHLQNQETSVEHWIELIDGILEQNGGYDLHKS
jgi:glycolate oxidase iron-sulfur subunit